MVLKHFKNLQEQAEINTVQNTGKNLGPPMICKQPYDSETTKKKKMKFEGYLIRNSFHGQIKL